MRHALGIWIAFSAFMIMTDIAAVTAVIPGVFGFRWQAALVSTLPLMCVVGSLLVFWWAPVGNRSSFKLVRGIGQIPVFARYLVFVVIVCCVVLAGVLFLKASTSGSIQSLTLPGDLEMSTGDRIQEEMGGEVIFLWGSETRVFFLQENREAVLRALERERVAIGE